MGQRCNHFTLEERCRLCSLMDRGLSINKIARRLGRHCRKAAESPAQTYLEFAACARRIPLAAAQQ